LLDWDRVDINWEGRGADRGLRGIEFFDGHVYVAASDEIFVFDKSFSIVESYQNEYLKHCHEIDREENKLYLTSTGYDSILEFDLKTEKFTKGFHLHFEPTSYALNRYTAKMDKAFNQYDNVLLGNKLIPRPKPTMDFFDPGKRNGPKQEDSIHINNVSIKDGTIYVAGTGLGHLLALYGKKLRSFSRIPYNTHNATPIDKGVIANNTYTDGIISFDSNYNTISEFSIVRYAEEKLLNTDLPEDHARQAFGRGLVVTNDGLVIGGSSPATISVYEFGRKEPIKTVNITMDIRNSIHGLELWPY